MEGLAAAVWVYDALTTNHPYHNALRMDEGRDTCISAAVNISMGLGRSSASRFARKERIISII
jgi:hypothetical protein